MNHKFYEAIKSYLEEDKFSSDELYKAGMENIKSQIEFYVDKTYTCESVIQELFIRGVRKYVNKKKRGTNPSF